MLLSDIETMVRQDLFDPAGPDQRWSTADIDHAIDKAVTHYSQYHPNIAYADIASQPFQRTYPYPTSWHPDYPVWWIERILYPLQIYDSAFATPGAGASAVPIAGSGLGIGLYQYAVTFLSPGGETTPSPTFSTTTTSGNQRVSISNIPLGPASSGANTIIGRNLYRSTAGDSTLYYLATIADNATTTYTDSAADSSLANMPTPPTINSSGIMTWPPIACHFAEYSNLFDSSTALATGGNLGTQGAIGPAAGPTGAQEPTFTLQLDNASLPRDNTQILRVFYATKHRLDSTGSTIPDVHRDIIVLGASAYCLEAYQIPTNDNFVFQDGSVHDRIDDTHIPTAWAAAASNKMEQFLNQLQQVKRDHAASTRTTWANIPRPRPRLSS